jgi:hypothetical protein
MADIQETLAMAITDEEAALQAIRSFDCHDDFSNEQQQAKDRIEEIVSSDNPFIDINILFGHYNVLYFRDLLVPRIEVSWSPYLKLNAGICELVRDPNNGNKFTRIRLKLSEPLLKYRPRSDVINTLLHEAIHAYFFVVTDWKHVRGDDGTGHGAGFVLLADAINSHGGYGISVHHTFHDEVDSYRTHVWQCDGPCKERSPSFGSVKRSMNRPPGESDFWWNDHQKECGGKFSKIAEPEPTKDQLRRMSPMQRAGRQKNKIDGWFKQSNKQISSHARSDDSACSNGSSLEPANREDNDIVPGEKIDEKVACPICGKLVSFENINSHLDTSHPP